MAANAPSPQDLQAVMAEVEKIGRVDPRAQAQLLDELKQVDPSLWPMAVQSVWSRVAYAQKYGKHTITRQLADRRSASATDCRREIASPSGYPTSKNPVTDYPSTGAVAELPPHRINAPAYPDTGARGINVPADQPPPDTRQPSGSGRVETPPGPNSGAALKRSPLDRTQTVEKPRPDGVIHTSYHSGPSQPLTPRKLSATQSNDGRSNDGQLGDGRSGDWRSHVATAITALESQLASQDKSAASDADGGGGGDATDHARLRMLQLLAGRRDDAMQEMPLDDSALRDFWSNELFGLDILLDTQRFSRDSHRATEAKRHLCQAVAALGEASTLEISNLAFCSEVQSYGSIKRFEGSEFAPGQRLLLYAEIDNFRSENTAKGYHTSLRSSFQIFDSSGRRIEDHKSTKSEEHCQSPRRDYFIGCDFRLPTTIYPGRHTLKLTVEDLKSHKVAESSIDFTVKEKK